MSKLTKSRLLDDDNFAQQEASKASVAAPNHAGDGLNYAPIVNNEFASLYANTSVSAHESILLANDSDPNGDALSIASYTQPLHGTLSRAADGTLTYTPNPGYTGDDSFTYMVIDTHGACVNGTVCLTVMPPVGYNPPPVITQFIDDVGAVQGNVPNGGTTDDNRPVLNGTAPPNAKVEVYDNGVKIGETTATPAGTWTLAPANALPPGTNTFTAVATLPGGTPATSAPYTVNCVPGGDNNLAPIAGDDYVSLPAGTSISGHESVLLGNDRDPEGGPLTITSYGQPANGTLTRAPDGTLTYVPRAGFTGTDTFTYTITDNKGATDVGQVYLTVTPVAPPLAAPTVTITEDANNDGTISRAELNGRIDVQVGLPNTAKVGDTINVMDNAGNVTGKVLTAADIAAGRVNLPEAFPAPAEGGTITVTAKLIDASGAASPTATDSAVIDTVGPVAPTVTITTDANNDGTINAAELAADAGLIDVAVGLPFDARPGDTLTVTDQAGRQVNKVLTPADIAAGTVSLPGAFPPPADGQPVTVTAKVTDPVGNASPSATDTATLHTSAPTPTVTLTDDKNNDGVITRPELAGQTRADVSVNLPAGAKAGDLLQVRDQAGNGVSKTLTPADLAAGKVDFNDAFPLPAPGQPITVYAKITDPNGNVSPEASDTAVFNGNFAPVATDDTASLRLGSGFPQTTGNVLTNDSDPDGTPAQLQVAGVATNPNVVPGTGVGGVLEGTYGHLSINPDGSYTYVADKVAGITSPVSDVFYYIDKDAGNANSNVAKLTIQVDPSLANVLSVTSPQADEGNDLLFTVATSSSAVPTTVTLALASGTATVGVDTASSVQVNFGAGWQGVVGNTVQLPAATTSFQVKLTTINDNFIESNETLTLTASSANGSQATGTGTILDNDLTGQVTGTEDVPLVLTWNNFNLQAVQGPAAKLVIESLPVDGKLQYNNGGTWTNATVGQQISRADIDAGKLRFLPDSNESGIDAYKAPGVGNKLNDYATFNYGADDGSGTTYSHGKMTVDIAPKADGGQSANLVMVSHDVGGIPFLPPNMWYAQVQVQLTGTPSPDVDGSERTLLGLTNLVAPSFLWYQGGPETVYQNGVLVQPDANGVVWVDPAVNFYIVSPTYCSFATDYVLYRQEVNSAGEVLDQVATPGQTWVYQSPIVLDLNGNGVETVDIDHGAYFDLTGSGVATKTGWASQQDGFLVRDVNGNGSIDNGTELFGNGTTLADGGKAQDGFAALGELDANHDGQVDAADAGFAQLQVWQDANGDGISQAGELLSLGTLGIVALNLAPAQSGALQNGNIIGLVSSYETADGASHEMADVWFQGSGETQPAESLSAADLLSDDSSTSRNLDAVMGGAPAPQATATASLPTATHQALAQHDYAVQTSRFEPTQDLHALA